jgi:hypothetical protein
VPKSRWSPKYLSAILADSREGSGSLAFDGDLKLNFPECSKNVSKESSEFCELIVAHGALVLSRL